MSDRQSFVRSICEAPEDDAPRLIYADWLDENGGAERAEFIRVQCELSRIGHAHPNYEWLKSNQHNNPCRQCSPLHGRERELLLNGPGALSLAGNCRWEGFGPAIGYDETNPLTFYWYAHDKVGFQFRRGFVDSITCTAADWLTHADAIRAEHPVTSVTLTSPIDWCYRASGVVLLPNHWEYPSNRDSGYACKNATREVKGDASSGVTMVAAILVAEWPGIRFELPRRETIHHIDGRVYDDVDFTPSPLMAAVRDVIASVTDWPVEVR